MAQINIHIYNDLVNIFRHEIEEVGYPTADITDPYKLIIMYFTMRKRLVEKRPRKVILPQDFTCPTALHNGLDVLVNKFVNGEDVNPHLSRTNKKLEFPDLMLFDWNIHHFHLGTTMEGDGYVSRTGDILYAIVSKDEVYFIKIQPHNHWSDLDLIETVHQNWPELIARFRIDGTPEVAFNSTEIAQLRKAHVNVMITTKDGTGYLGMGMGFMTDGSSSDAALQAVRKAHEAKNIEKRITEELNCIESDLGRNGMEFEVEAVRMPSGIYAIEHNYNLGWLLYNIKSIKDQYGL